MKKGKKILGLLLCTAMTVSLAACGKNSSGNGTNGGGSTVNGSGNDAAKQGVYKEEPLNVEGLPADSSINDVVLLNGKLYMLVQEYRYDDMQGMVIKLVTANEDGSNAETKEIYNNLTPNPDYNTDGNGEDGGDGDGDNGAVPLTEDAAIDTARVSTQPAVVDTPVEDTTDAAVPEDNTEESDGEEAVTDEPVADEPSGDTYDNSYISNTVFCDGGIFLLVESSKTDADGNYTSKVDLYAYNLDGTEKYNKELFVNEGDNYQYLNQLAGSKDGEFAGVSDSELFLFDTEGNETGRVEIDTSNGWMNNMFFDKNGDINLFMVNNDYTKLNLYKYDKTGKQIGEPVEVCSKLLNYSINLGVNYDIFVTDNQGAYGYNIGDSDLTMLFSYINSDINSNDVNSLYEIDENRILMTYYSSDDGNNKLAILTHVDPKDVPDKQTLVLGCYYLEWDLRERIVNFNKSNDNYRITVTDYSQYNTGDDYTAGYTQLNNDILAGKMPDMLALNSTSDIPVDSYISKGLFADLSEMIKNDSELNYDDYLSNVFEAYMHDGKLYTLVPKFTVNTVMGKTSIVGDKEGWTMEDLKALMEKYPDASVFGDTTTRGELLWMLMMYSGSQFVDRETGKCSFDSQEFVDLLEFTKQFPEEFDYDSLPDDYWQNSQKAYRDGKILLMSTNISDMESYISNRGLFGEPVTLIGFPAKEGNGAVINANSVYLISAKSKNQDAAWQFLRYYLTDEYQKDGNDSWSLPIKKDALKEKINKGTERPYWTDADGNKEYYDYTAWFGDEEVVLDPLTQEEADHLYDYISSVTQVYYSDDSLSNIITEESAAFFAGQKSAQDVADIIQSRAQIYINESR